MCSRKMAQEIKEWIVDLVGQRFDFKVVVEKTNGLHFLMLSH